MGRYPISCQRGTDVPPWSVVQDHLAHTVLAVATTLVGLVLGRLLVVVVSAGVSNTDMIDIMGSSVLDSARVTVVGVDS